MTKKLTKNIHSTIVEDHKAREENLRIEEQKRKKLRIEEREEKLRFEQLSLYLKLFERQAQRLNIDQENWVSHLLGLLPTEVSHIIARELDDKANSYEHVKDLLLKRFKLTQKVSTTICHSPKAPERTWIDFTMS
ncbi:uncharacterized protein TNCV_2045131 [Trichonephila clavipes]|uniref:Uncharacterized protein n=1 Tax=Trichonephila clavipes TaxID=2585209 RepID=A0A8X6SQJ6_TRICX|nr:uncharacterized protein TNCV_2045131 [Trichonephila clavipes]